MQNCWNYILEKWWFEDVWSLNVPFFGTVILVGNVSLRGLCLTSALIWSRFGVTVFWVLSDLLLYLACRISFGFLSVCLAFLLVVGLWVVWLFGRAGYLFVAFCSCLFLHCICLFACFLFGLLVRIRASLCPRNMFDPQWSHLLCQDAMTWWNGEQITQQNYNKHQVHNGWLNSHCPTHCLQKCGDHLYTSSAKCSRRIAPKTSC